MTLKIGLAMVALGLGAWVGARSVKHIDNKTSDITIIDKATGQKIFITNDYTHGISKFRYIDKYRTWTKLLYNTNDKFDGVLEDVILTNNALYATIRDDMQCEKSLSLSKFNLDGERIWCSKIGVGDNSRLELTKNDKLIKYNYLPQDSVQSVDGYKFADNGDEFHYTIRFIKSDSIILIDKNRNIASDIEKQIQIDIAMEISSTGFLLYDVNKHKAIKDRFFTPPRKNCGDYEPNISTLIKKEKLILRLPPLPSLGVDDFELTPAQKSIEVEVKEYAKYTSNVVRGEYIYSHRADHCGKFTYRFHWTDLKHPGPVILEGWQ